MKPLTSEDVEDPLNLDDSEFKELVNKAKHDKEISETVNQELPSDIKDGRRTELKKKLEELNKESEELKDTKQQLQDNQESLTNLIKSIIGHDQ